VLDYKSNRLRGYGPAQMAEAMEHSEYPLQALIYTVALHRWLRFRLGGAYDYARDFGGVRYLFCRGLDATAAAQDGVRPGVQAWRFERALVESVDALFAGREPAEVAAGGGWRPCAAKACCARWTMRWRWACAGSIRRRRTRSSSPRPWRRWR